MIARNTQRTVRITCIFVFVALDVGGGTIGSGLDTGMPSGTGGYTGVLGGVGSSIVKANDGGLGAPGTCGLPGSGGYTGTLGVLGCTLGFDNGDGRLGVPDVNGGYIGAVGELGCIIGEVNRGGGLGLSGTCGISCTGGYTCAVGELGLSFVEAGAGAGAGAGGGARAPRPARGDQAAGNGVHGLHTRNVVKSGVSGERPNADDRLWRRALGVGAWKPEAHAWTGCDTLLPAQNENSAILEGAGASGAWT